MNATLTPTRQRRPMLLSAVVLLVFLLASCATTPPTRIIALLAPFEGRDAEIGYNALYAARLALREYGDANIELLPIDDGGNAQNAIDRAKAFTHNPQIRAIIALGTHATAPETQTASGDLPVLIVGNWTTTRAKDVTFLLSNPALNDHITAPPHLTVTDAAAYPAPVTGSEIFALQGFGNLRDALHDVTIVSSGTLPTDDFVQRYQQGENFAPPPNLLATLVYDATKIAADAVQTGTRASTATHIANNTFSGINGEFRFERGVWANAPIHHYRYQADRTLAPITP